MRIRQTVARHTSVVHEESTFPQSAYDLVGGPSKRIAKETSTANAQALRTQRRISAETIIRIFLRARTTTTSAPYWANFQGDGAADSTTGPGENGN